MQYLGYIEDGHIIYRRKASKQSMFERSSTLQEPALVKLYLKGRFHKYFKRDMDKEQTRNDFMNRYGDPLSGFD